jgi:hypothetical protein
MKKLGGWLGKGQVSAAERPAVVKELNELNKQLSEFYEAGFGFTKYKTPSNGVASGPSYGYAPDRFAETQANYHGRPSSFYEKQGGTLNYLNYFK